MKISSEKRQTLESMARKYTSPSCDVIRAKIVLLADEGLSNDVIASRLDTPRQISYLEIFSNQPHIQPHIQRIKVVNINSPMKAPHIRPNSSGFAKPNVAISIGYKTIIESQYIHLDL